MLIGKDFDKIELELFGYQFVEPNAMVGDGILFFIALFIAFKIKKLSREEKFFKHWYIFFIIFGLSFLAGGLGHFVYNYWGIPGKYFAWIASILAIYLAEQAMISIYPDEKKKKLFKSISIVKMLVTAVAELYVFTAWDLVADPQKGLLIPSINSALGLLMSLGFLGVYYQLKMTTTFKFFWISLLIMIPSGIAQSIKFNIAPWFDRNDFSHVLLGITMCLYWLSIRGYSKFLQDKK